jgi:hypothetical protein
MTNMAHHSLDSLLGQTNQTRVSSTKVGGKCLTEEISHCKLEDKVGEPGSGLARKETRRLDLVVFV